jgi:AcrR family transcriptional regulator
MENDRMDRRVRRTRQQIRESLFVLMRTMSYEKIRIAHIAEGADISRSTFYLHFETKDDLISSVLDEIIGRYIQALDAPESRTGSDPTRLLFSLWQENTEALQLIVRSGLEYRIFERLRAANKPHTHLENIDDPLLDRYAHAMVSGASFALLLEWTKDNCRVPAVQMAKLYDMLQINDFFDEVAKGLPGYS